MQKWQYRLLLSMAPSRCQAQTPRSRDCTRAAKNPTSRTEANLTRRIPSESVVPCSISIRSRFAATNSLTQSSLMHSSNLPSPELVRGQCAAAAFGGSQACRGAVWVIYCKGDKAITSRGSIYCNLCWVWGFKLIYEVLVDEFPGMW